MQPHNQSRHHRNSSIDRAVENVGRFLFHTVEAGNASDQGFAVVGVHGRQGTKGRAIK